MSANLLMKSPVILTVSKKTGTSAKVRKVPAKKSTPSASVKTTYGAVTIISRQPSAAELKQNLKESAAVIKRFGEKISRPGVNLHHLAGIPTFAVDTKDPTLIVRDFNGKKERGMFVKGKFKVLSA